MVNSTNDATNSSNECPDPNANSTSTQDKSVEFDWNQQLQGYVLGAFFYGYILTQVPGGWLANRFGGKRLFGYGIMCTSVLTIVTPFAARYSVYLFIAARVVEGIGEGVTFPAMHAMWGHWAPVCERSRLVAFSYAGSHIGTVLALPISGFLIDSGLAGGWPSVFYVFGAVAVLWCIVWLLVIHDYPSKHPRISRAERLYIENSTGRMENFPTPWKQIFTSPALWGLAAAHFANSWGFYTLLTCLPTYLKNVLRFDMKENSLLSALPYAFCYICQNIAGVMADVLRDRGYLSTKNTRKLFNSVGMLVPAVLLVSMGYVGCSHAWVMTFLSLSVGVNGLTASGFSVNHLDIAPQFAGILMGITNALATVTGFASPMVVGYLTNHNETRHQWEIIFYIAAVVYALGAIAFIILGEGEEQPWAKCVASISQRPRLVDCDSGEEEEGESCQYQREVCT